MTSTSMKKLPWKKSSKSHANSACIETSLYSRDDVAIRDTKHPHSGMLQVDRTNWRAMLSAIKHGDLDS
jgi:hypothetical protein